MFRLNYITYDHITYQEKKKRKNKVKGRKTVNQQETAISKIHCFYGNKTFKCNEHLSAE